MRGLRHWLAVGILGLPLTVCGFDVTYGSFFTVRGVTQKQGKPVLPTTRGKYVNVRVLDKETVDFLRACTENCVQQGADGQTEVTSLRAAKTREGMWIAEVAVDKRWLLTFLIFQNPTGYGVVAPEAVAIKQKSWRRQVEQQLAEAVTRLQTEEQHAL